MALASFDLLGSVVATLFSAYSGRLYRLGVHYAGARLRISLQAHPHSLAQGGVHPLPGAIQAPGAKVMEDGLPRWKIVRQESPGTAAANDVEDGVEYFAGAM